MYKKKTLSKRGINFFQKLLRRYLLDAMSSTDRDQSFHPCERKNVPLSISSLRTMRQIGHVQSEFQDETSSLILNLLVEPMF